MHIQPNKLDPNKNSNHRIYLKTAGIGLARVTIGFPVEHPIDSIKTQWQARPHLKSEFAIIKLIYSEKGIKGFYAGALPNYVRCILKNCYKYPLMIGLPKTFQKKVENHKLCKFLTGITIAFVEACITCPLERVKVHFMTFNPFQLQQKLSYKTFSKDIQGKMFKELFRGFTPLFLRQLVSWSTLLQTDHFAKTKIRKALEIESHQKIPALYLVPASVLVALVNTSFVMPLDCVKTHMEKVNPQSTYTADF